MSRIDHTPCSKHKTKQPLCIDLYAGLGGWTEGFLAERWDVVGFDIERHQYWMPEAASDGDGHKGTKPVEKRGWTQGCAVSLGLEGSGARVRTRLASYPAQLVLQDILTVHGSQFRGADCIVASPPCQRYSWLAMPWSRSKSDHSKAAKALRKEWETNGPDNRLFDACFRIQREAIEATGEPCPNCSHLRMYMTSTLCSRCNCTGRINTHHIPLIVENVRGAQPWVGPARWSYGSFYLWGDVPAIMPTARAMKTSGGSWFRERNGEPQPGIRHEDRGTKIGGDWFSDPNSTCRKHGSRSNARKAASAQIAKIPFELSTHIARVYYPRNRERVA